MSSPGFRFGNLDKETTEGWDQLSAFEKVTRFNDAVEIQQEVSDPSLLFSGHGSTPGRMVKGGTGIPTPSIALISPCLLKDMAFSYTVLS